jgi:hypothetical protein
MTGTPHKTAFILGCGRSGTSILGRLLSKHADITYLNDQWMLWAQTLPEFDICGRVPYDPAYLPPVALAAEHATPNVRERFLPALEARRRGKAVLVEKLAVNNFRIPFLLALAPDAYLISIVRHGVEVAHSIEQRATLGKWYGPSERKWTCLCEHARRAGLEHLLPLCGDFYTRGLLEWRMSTDAADAVINALRPPRLLRIRYEELVVDPVGVCERLERFLGVLPRPVMRRFAAEMIARRSPPADARPTPPHTEDIAGVALRRLGYWPAPVEVGP